MPYKDRDERLSYSKSYREANKARIAEQIRGWAVDHSGELREYKSKYHASRLENDREGVRKQTRAAHLKRMYGITPDQYRELAEAQKGCCAVCEEPAIEDDPLHVDHDHHTGEIRGLLCGHCNRAIGLLRDDPKIAEKALSYLRHWEKKQ